LAQNTTRVRLFRTTPPATGPELRPPDTPGGLRPGNSRNRPSADGLGPFLKHLHNHRLWQLILAAMVVPLALIAFWPTPVDQPVSGQLSTVLNFLHHHGIPRWFNYDFVEKSANVGLFLPVGFVAALAFPNKRWWQIGAFGMLMSACIELGQFLFLHSRFASPSDVMTNTSGAVIGALVALLATKKGRPAAFRQRASQSQ